MWKCSSIRAVVEFHAGQGLGTRGTFGFRTEQYGRVCTLQFRALRARVGQRLQCGAKFAYASEQFRIAARVGHHRGVERLGTRRGLPPLEEADGIGAHGHVGQGVAHELAGALARVQRLPLDGGGGVLHHVPRLAGADCFDGVAFGLVEVEQHVVAEPFVIQLLGRVDHAVAAHVARQQHLGKAVDVLVPERRAPRGNGSRPPARAGCARSCRTSTWTATRPPRHG